MSPPRRRFRRTPTVDPIAELAATVHRVSVLVAGGVGPRSVWSYLDGEAARSVAGQVSSGVEPSAALVRAIAEAPERARPAWRAVAAAWHVATVAGAPLAPTLERIARALRDVLESDRAIRSALAAPVATTRLVTALPAVAVLMGLGLGFDMLGVLFGTPLGWMALASGGALLAVGRRWSRRLVARATPRARIPGIRLDLTAIAMSGGASPDRARELVEEACAAAGLPDEATTDAERPPGATRVASALEVLDLSRRAGVPAVGLLVAEAHEARREHAAASRDDVARLGVALMVPLGVCVLPAFVALGVVPMLVSVISSTVSGR